MSAEGWLWIIAGPNGSGKSTLARSGALQAWHPSIPSVAQSPDDIAKLLPPVVPGASEFAYVRAAQTLSDSLVEEAVHAGRTVLVETVGSSPKFFALIDLARQIGRRFGIIYVTVELADLNVARVAHRVALGGHDVPRERILARRDASHDNFPQFAGRADAGLVIDNSLTDRATHQPQMRILAEKREGGAWRVIDGSVAPGLTHWIAAQG
ncbi:AAA family ATPase [Falsiroseomonas ponticola]|uniref:AAA family ATPase n=1 Tax=Falsiroseomonas ponticola TaxID=2786951 RepID=UPI001931414F|nr:AAA family ATPase [Roseomonas ponticola]